MIGPSEINHFNQIAHEYVQIRRSLPGTYKYLQYLYNSIIGMMNKMHSGAMVLEIMSGQGDLAMELQKRIGAQVVALDLSQKILKYNNCKMLINGNAEMLPFKDEVFDAVMVCAGLHHLSLSKLDESLSEIRRVLKKDGKFYFFEPTDDFLLAHLLRSILYKRLEYLGNREEEIIFYREELLRSFKKAGFVYASIRPFGSIAYALISQVDALKCLRPLARSRIFAMLLIWLERMLFYIPVLNQAAFGSIGFAQK